MACAETKLKLETLLELLLKERALTRDLDASGLQAVVASKEELLAEFNPQPEDVEGCEDLLKKIDHENRRNAYLLWSGLSVVRDLMGFFGKSVCPSVYGQSGQEIAVHQGGRLLSGRV